MGKRIIVFSAKMLREIFLTGSINHFKVEQGLPDDAELIDVRFNGFKDDKIEMLFRSNKWEREEGTSIPFSTIIFTNINKQ